MFVPEAHDLFGWSFIVLVGLLTPTFILLDLFNMPLSFGKFTEEGFSKKLRIKEGKYSYRKSFIVVYTVPMVLFILTCMLSISWVHMTAHFVAATNVVMAFLLKRLLEVCLVHKYSHSTVPLSSTLVMACSLSLGFVATAQSICSAQTQHAEHALLGVEVSGLCVFCVGVVCSWLVHQQLANLRVASSSRNYLALSALPGMYQATVCPNYVMEMVALAGLVMVVRTLAALLFFVALCACMLLRLRRNKHFYDKLGAQEQAQDQLRLGDAVGDKAEGHEVEVDDKGVSAFATIGRDIKLSDLNDVERSTDESDSSQTSISLDYVE